MRRAAGVGRFALGLLLPLAAYYVLRWAGVGIYLALLASTLGSALPALVTLARTRRVDGTSAYFTAMTVGSVGIALLSGSTRFLLAKEAVLTGATGIWFLLSARSSRPLSYVFSRPLLEGRLRWPGDWDRLWEEYPGFRHVWRVSSVLFGVGISTDAAARVVLAYTLPPDSVPALATALYAVTTVVLIVVTNVYYLRSGVHDLGSSLYRPAVAPTGDG